MSIFNEFPYTNMHELNLDWLIREMKSLKTQVASMAIEARVFDNVAQMAADTSISSGSVIYANGYYSNNDSGDNLYYISEDDEGLGILLDSGLYANPITTWCYDLRKLGAKADGITNDRTLIQGILTKINNGEIPNKPIYAPSGRYALNDCLVIPSNIWLFGDGESTYFYLNKSSNWSGQVIGVCGSNVILERINGGYKGGADATILFTQGQTGFIGISPSTYEGWINNQQILEPHYNITCRDIWTDCQYCLQTENTEAGSIIDHVVYQNIHAPNAMVSVQAKSPNSIKNIYMHDVDAAVIRLGQGNRIENLILDDFRCELLINRNQGSEISNGYVKIIAGSKAYNSRIWENYGNAPIGTKTGCSITNVIADANGILNDGINVETTTTLTFESEPVNLTNVTTLNAVVYSIHGGGYVQAVNCAFDVEKPAQLNAQRARLVNCAMQSSLYDNGNRSATGNLTLASGYSNYSTSAPAYYERSGNWIKICGMISASGFTAGEAIATLPSELRPLENKHGIGLIQTAAATGITTINDEAVYMSINTSGEISVGSAGIDSADLAACTMLKFDILYSIL